MAQRERPRRIWVELEVRTGFRRVMSGKRKVWAYLIMNPRTMKMIESSGYIYESSSIALGAGLSYLRRTYNTGRPQGER